MKVFKVFDEEWEEIMGRKQLIEFVTYQIQDNFIMEDIENKDSDLYAYTEDVPTDLVKKVLEGGKITLEEAIKLLPVRAFDITELELY